VNEAEQTSCRGNKFMLIRLHIERYSSVLDRNELRFHGAHEANCQWCIAVVCCNKLNNMLVSHWGVGNSAQRARIQRE
jgi:hypothetical protein